MTTPAEQAALDLLGQGCISVLELSGELVRRQIVGADRPIGQSYALARATLAGLVEQKRAQVWPDGICYTLPSTAAIETERAP